MVETMSIPPSPTITSDSGPPNTTIGHSLIHHQMITNDQLVIALREQSLTGGMLGDVLIRLGFITEDQRLFILAQRLGLPITTPQTMPPDQDALRLIPLALAQETGIVPLHVSAMCLTIATADPYDLQAIDKIRRHLPPTLHIQTTLASPTSIAQAMTHHYGQEDGIANIVKDISQHGMMAAWTDRDHPIIRLVNLILSEAVARDASDLHLEPEGPLLRLRLRIDGSLATTRTLHSEIWPALSHRIKIMAGLNIADQRILQDGRFSQVFDGHEIDFRVAIMPTTHGENIVIRVLNRHKSLRSLGDLGMSPSLVQKITALLHRPEGLILVTGPTGCGKTTTLYAMLGQLNHDRHNIMTLEEPVEYHIPTIRQTALHRDRGLTFADGIRGIMRQDPDIIMVGEIRDHDTATMALRATMTGHLVLSTLHCQNALTSLTRLYDLGMTPHQLTGQIAGVLAQRLVRRLCSHCAESHPITENEYTLLAPWLSQTMPTLLYHAVGCHHCQHTGYKGRVAVAELWTIDPETDHLILQKSPPQALREKAIQNGYIPMVLDGLDKLCSGLISMDSLCEAILLSEHRS